MKMMETPGTEQTKEAKGIAGLREEVARLKEVVEQRASEVITERALQESEERYRALVESSSDHIFMLNREGRYVASNRQVTYLGVGDGEALVGREVREVFRGGEGEVYEKHLQRVVGTGSTVEFEQVLGEGEGARHYLNTLYSITREGKVWAVGGICRDITGQKRAEKELRRSREQLFQAQKMESLGTLVAGMAHEINNPINSISLNAPLLQRIWLDLLPVLEEHAAEEPSRKYGGLTYAFLRDNLGQLLADLNLAANRITKLVASLKDFARRSDVTDRHPTNINEAVENALRLASTTIRKSGIALTLDLDKDAPLVEGNLPAVEQIILNLTINAIQAITHNHGEIRIATRFDQGRRGIRLSVYDNGRGVDPAIAGRIFDPFVTSRSAEGGTGLGLSITYGLVNALHGEISFTGEEGKGTTFHVFFPVEPRTREVKILVVDDDENIREVLTRRLSLVKDFALKAAGTGVEACVMLGTYRPDLLLLDMFMPEMDGLEVFRTIKNNPELSGMKVVLLTGYPDDVRVRQAVELGVLGVLVKPFDLEELVETITRIVGR